MRNNPFIRMVVIILVAVISYILGRLSVKYLGTTPTIILTSILIFILLFAIYKLNKYIKMLEKTNL